MVRRMVRRSIGARTLTLALVTVAGAGALGCGNSATSEEGGYEANAAVKIADSAVKGAPKDVTLTSDAVRRLDLQTTEVVDPAAIPFSAVIYDKKGESWVYAVIEGTTFRRTPITITRIASGVARLSQGPRPGVRIATASVIELYGAENGVGGGR